MSDAELNDLYTAFVCVRSDLQDLQGECIRGVEALGSPQQLVDQMQHGASRRLGTISRALANVFHLFPPEAQSGISRDTIADATINLHAFLINMSGVADNWAWSYVLRHGLTMKQTDVGLFLKATKARLPTALSAYVEQPRLQDWHRQYAKDFRDALAHRVPPYIPMRVDPADLAEVNKIQAEPPGPDRLGRLLDAISRVEKPLAGFIHSHGGAHGQSPLILLHPQLVKDAELLVEMGRVFLQHWATPPRP